MNGTQHTLETTERTPEPPVSPSAAAPPPGPDSRAQPPAPPYQHQPGYGRPPRKSPLVACLLSFLPGVGQIYVGYYKLGFIHNLVFGATTAFMIATGDSFESLIAVLGIFLAFFFVYNIVDAGRRAVHYNLAIEGGQQLDMPEMRLELPGFGGSIAGGAALLVVGVLLLMNTRFGISLDWIEEWWPVALIGLGAYLLGKEIQDRRARQAAADTPPPVAHDTSVQ